MPASERGREDVLPEMNQRSSAITARVNTRLVVRRGKMGNPDGVLSVNLRGFGANIEYVPVPVLEKSPISALVETFTRLFVPSTCQADVRQSRGSHGLDRGIGVLHGQDPALWLVPAVASYGLPLRARFRFLEVKGPWCCVILRCDVVVKVEFRVRRSGRRVKCYLHVPPLSVLTTRLNNHNSHQY
jgi:hypothetical protein